MANIVILGTTGLDAQFTSAFLFSTYDAVSAFGNKGPRFTCSDEMAESIRRNSEKCCGDEIILNDNTDSRVRYVRNELLVVGDFSVKDGVFETSFDEFI